MTETPFVLCDLIQKTPKMMAPQLEYHGVGSAVMRFIHPLEHIWSKYPNPHPSQHLENCTMIRQEVKNVSRRDLLTLIVHHEEFKHADGTFIELYAIKRYWKVHQSGHPDYFFDRVQKTHPFQKQLMITLMVKFTPHKQLWLLSMLLT